MKIVIVGAGLGGLSAAFCFSRKGHCVTVLEQRKTLSPQGSSLGLRPGASRILDTWGLTADIQRIADYTQNVSLRDLETGALSRSVVEKATEVPDWGTHRSELIQLLYQKALDVGANVQFDRNVRCVSETLTEATVELADGTILLADLVLAADGIRSRIRDQILHPKVEPRISDITCYGIVVPTAKLVANPVTANNPNLNNTAINVWMGDRTFVVGVWNHVLQLWGGIFGIQGESHSEQKGLWDDQGDIQWVRDWFRTKNTCPELMALLEMSDSCDRWRLAEMPDLPTWSSPQSRVLLLGDSCHGMYPNAAQGFSTIIEDIGVLEFLLDRAGSNATQSLPEIARVWEDVRKPRVERIKEYAKWSTLLFAGEIRPANERVEKKSVVKDASLITPDRDARFNSVAFVKWTLDYDAVEEVRKYLDNSKPRL